MKNGILELGKLGNGVLGGVNAHFRRPYKLFDLKTFVLPIFSILKNTIRSLALISFSYVCLST